MANTSSRLLRPAWLLAAILFALCAAGAAVQFESGNASRAMSLAILSLMAPAAALILRRSASAGERMVAALLFVHGTTGGIAAIQLLRTPDILPRAARSYDAYGFLLDMVWVAACLVAIVMMQRFPRRVEEGALEGVRSRPWRLVLQSLVRGRWQLALGGAFMSMALLEAWDLGNLLVAVLAIGYGYANFRVANAIERRKLFWMVFSGVAFFSLTLVWLGLLAAGRALDMSSQTLSLLGNILGNLIGVVALAGPVLAVLAAPAIDPRPWIQHTALYGTSLSALLFAFAVIENLLAGAVTQALEVNGALVSAISGGALAMLLQPLHQRLESWARSGVASWRARRASHTARATPAIE